MKKLFLILIHNFSFCILNCSQRYGWVDISNYLPIFTDTVTLPNMHLIRNNEGWIFSAIDGGQSFTIKTDLPQKRDTIIKLE